MKRTAHLESNNGRRRLISSVIPTWQIRLAHRQAVDDVLTAFGADVEQAVGVRGSLSRTFRIEVSCRAGT